MQQVIAYEQERLREEIVDLSRRLDKTVRRPGLSGRCKHSFLRALLKDKRERLGVLEAHHPVM